MSVRGYLSVGAQVAAGMLLAMGAASAETLDYSGYTVTGNSVTVDTPVAGTGVAGLIRLITTSGTYNAWCIDLYNSLLGSGTYNTTNIASVTSLNNSQIGQIGALMVHGDQLVGAAGPGQTADDIATAIQVAIWTVEYGTSGFTYDAVNPTVSALAPDYYADASGGVWAPFTHYAALAGTGADLTTDQTLAAVPEVSTWAMMLFGFVGLGCLGYRARQGVSPGADGQTT